MYKSCSEGRLGLLVHVLARVYRVVERHVLRSTYHVARRALQLVGVAVGRLWREVGAVVLAAVRVPVGAIDTIAAVG